MVYLRWVRQTYGRLGGLSFPPTCFSGEARDPHGDPVLKYPNHREVEARGRNGEVELANDLASDVRFAADLSAAYDLAVGESFIYDSALRESIIHLSFS